MHKLACIDKKGLFNSEQDNHRAQLLPKGAPVDIKGNCNRERCYHWANMERNKLNFHKDLLNIDRAHHDAQKTFR